MTVFNNFFDILIISIIVITTLYGFYLGLIATLILFIAIIFGKILFNNLLPQFVVFLDTQTINPLIQILIFIILIFIIIKFCKIFIYKVIFFPFLDKIIGGILGFLGSIILISYLLKIIKSVSYFQDEIANSALIPYVIQLVQYLPF